MITFLSILQVLACILLVAFVLIQPAKAGGSAFGPSDASSMTGQSAGTSPPFKMTMLAAAFLALSSLFINWTKINEDNTSVIDEIDVPLDSALAPDLTGSAPTTDAMGVTETENAGASEH